MMIDASNICNKKNLIVLVCSAIMSFLGTYCKQIFQIRCCHCHFGFLIDDSAFSVGDKIL